MEKEVKKPKTVLFTNLLYQFVIIVFFTVFFMVFVVEYFLFMFISVVIAGIITLFLKSNPDILPDKILTQQIGNLLKAITDIVVSNDLGKNELRDILQKTVIWNLRNVKTIPSSNKEILEDVKKYILKKLAPESEE